MVHRYFRGLSRLQHGVQTMTLSQFILLLLSAYFGGFAFGYLLVWIRRFLEESANG